MVSQTNILPIISGCNIDCVFCSHKNNPSNVKTYTVPKLDLTQVEELIEYLSTDRKIVIGDSASRIVEGEPFLYKSFMYILNRIRQKYKVTPIQITTNGSFLTEQVIKELALLEPIEINISLNSSNDENRTKLINDKKPKVAINACKLLSKYNIKYNGSIVLMPHVVGWEDIKNTVEYLCQNSAQLVRLFIPGVTKYAKEKIDFCEISATANKLIKEFVNKYEVPIIIEPPIIDNLNAVIEGVIKDSPAHMVGLKYNDIIIRVDGKEPVCRVDAYTKAFNRANPVLLIKRETEEFEVAVNKLSKQSCGFVVSYDIDPDITTCCTRAVHKNKSKSPLIITSELGFNIVKKLFDKEGEIYNIYPVKNDFFGGTIMVSGLLTVQDIMNNIEDIKNKFNPDLLLLPGQMFDLNLEDLTGISYNEITKKSGINVELI